MLLLHGLRCLTGLVNSGDSIWGLEGLGRKGDTCGSGCEGWDPSPLPKAFLNLASLRLMSMSSFDRIGGTNDGRSAAALRSIAKGKVSMFMNNCNILQHAAFEGSLWTNPVSSHLCIGRRLGQTMV